MVFVTPTLYLFTLVITFIPEVVVSHVTIMANAMNSPVSALHRMRDHRLRKSHEHQKP